MDNKEKNGEKRMPSLFPMYMMLLSLFFVLAGILILNIGIYSQNEIASTQPKFPDDAQTTQVHSSPCAIYIMRENGGKISIYDAKTENIIKTLDVYVFTLPESDREYLKQGIEIYSESELISLIEDYTG